MGGGQSIPQVPPHAHRCHIDTAYLLPLILGGDSDEDLAARARRILEREGSRSVGISLISIGEAFTEIVSEKESHRPRGSPSLTPLQRLNDMVSQGKAVVCWARNQTRGADLLAMAMDVRRRATVGLADSLIVAGALACRECRTLYTSDRELLVNPSLNSYLRSGGRHLEIIES